MLGREDDTDGDHHGGERGAPGTPPESAFEPEEFSDMGLAASDVTADDLGGPGELTPEALWRLEQRVSEQLPCEQLPWSASPETRSLAYDELRRRPGSAALVERLNEALEQAGFVRPKDRGELPLTLQWLVEIYQDTFDQWAATRANADLVERLAAWFDDPSEPVQEFLDGKAPAELVEDLLQCLPERERRIIESRFGLGHDVSLGQRNSRPPSEEFGVSRRRIGQLSQRALGRMRFAPLSRFALGAVQREIVAHPALVGEALELDHALPVLLRHLTPEAHLLAMVHGLSREDLRHGFGAVVGNTLFVGVRWSAALERAVAAFTGNEPQLRPWLIESCKADEPSAEQRIPDGQPLPVTLRVQEGFVFEAKRRPLAARAAKLYRLAVQWTQPISHWTLRAPSVLEALGDNDSVDPGRSGLRAINRAPHLFTRLGDLGWMTVCPPGADLDPRATSPAPLPTAPSRSTGPERTLIEQIEACLEREGIATLAQISDSLLLGSGPERTSGGVQGTIGARPDRFERVAPVLYARRGCDLVPHLGKALNKAQVRHFVHGRLAGDGRGTFALWCAEMEQLWCTWGESALPRPLFRALLAVVDPSTWPTDAATRRDWEERKAREGSTAEYEVPGMHGETKIPPAERVFATLLDLRDQGRTNWLRVNRIIGARVGTGSSWPTLALLARVGAVDAPPAWHLEHVARRECRWLHGDAWSALARFRLTHATLTWDDLPIRYILYEARISEFERPGRRRPASSHQPWYTEHIDLLDERIDEILRSDLELPPEGVDGETDSASPEN